MVGRSIGPPNLPDPCYGPGDMRDPDPPRIGGAPVIRLHAAADSDGPAIIGADIAPGRGMLLLQARARLPGRGRPLERGVPWPGG